MPDPTLPAEYFDRLYAHDADPWRISHGWYEQRKRALTMASLPDATYRTGVEIGCGNGDLTVELAERCEHLIAIDGSERAVAAAREVTRRRTNVEVRRARVPDDCPEEPADLVLLSEVGYYLSPSDLTTTLDRLLGGAPGGATVVIVHWRHGTDYPLTGDQVHRVVRSRPELSSVATYRDEDFLLDVLSLGPRGSVARRCGVV